MANNLCVDWGNSRVKLALFQKNEIIESFNFSKEEALGKLQSILDQFQPATSIICKVSEVPEEFISILKSNTKFLLLHADTKLPMINAYNSVDTLGMDRVALSVGMQDIYPHKNNLVVCLGTAITYNFSQKSGIFRGGNITPGMRMRFKALHDFTSLLPLVEESGEILLLGYDTTSCIRSGVVLGIAAEIDGMINNYRTQYPDFNVIITGGDSAFFVDRLKNKTFADDQLLLKGLNSILNHNAL